MKKLVGCFLFLLTLTFISSTALAQTFESALSYEVDGTELKTSNNYFLAGNNVSLYSGGNCENVFVAGNDVSFDAPQLGNVYVAGNSIHMGQNASVENVYMAGNQIDLKGNYDKIKVTGNLINIHGSATDVAVAGNSIEFTGVAQSLKLAGESLYIDGLVQGDVEVAGKEIVFGPNAQIGGSITVRSEQYPTLMGSISSEQIRYIDHHFDFNFRMPTFVTVGLEVFDLLLLFLMTLLFVKFGTGVLDQFEHQFFEKPYKPLLIGFAALILIPLIMVISAITIVGIPITIVLGCVYGIMLYLSPVVSGALVGRRLSQHQNPYLLACIGVLIIELCGYLPFIGGFISFATVLFSLGSFICLLVCKKTV